MVSLYSTYEMHKLVAKYAECTQRQMLHVALGVN